MKPLHIICGKCGYGDGLKYHIDLQGYCDDEGNEHPEVYISCPNCGALTELGEVLG